MGNNFCHGPYVTFDLKDFRFSWSLLGRIFAVGAPASFSFVIMALGGAVFNRLLVVYSDETVAAFQVGSRIDHIYLLPVIALSASLVTLVGMFHGAQRRDLVRDVIVYAMTRAVLIAFVMGTLFFILAPNFLGAFTDSEVIARTGVGYLRIGVFSYPFIAIVMLTGRVLQGMGNGTPVFVLSLLRVVLISGPLAYIFVLKMGKPVTWVWIAMLIGMVVTAILAFVWLKHALSHGDTIPETADAAISGL